MADEVLTPQKLLDASADCETIEIVTNGDDQTDVTSRLGQTMPTISKALRIILQMGIDYYKTQAELLASTPIAGTKAAKALDTKKLFLWENNAWTDTGLSELELSKSYTLNEIALLKTGGSEILASKPAFITMGYFNSSNVWVAGTSTSGYMTTDYVDVANKVKLLISLYGTTGAAVGNFYDENKNFISHIVGNSSAIEREVAVPATAKFAKFTNNAGVHLTPTVKHTVSALLDDPTLLKQSNLKTEVSLNLAKREYIVADKYVNNTGAISTGVGWKYLKVPAGVGKTYSFGNFAIDTAGYYSFTDLSGAVLQFGTLTTSTMPIHVTAPANAAFLNIDIARPTNTASQYEKAIVNEGATLIEYVDPVDVIVEISGYKIAGTGGGSEPAPLPDNVVIQGDNATLADIIADSITTGALIANLPTSIAGLEIGQAYIDSGFIKVVM